VTRAPPIAYNVAMTTRRRHRPLARALAAALAATGALSLAPPSAAAGRGGSLEVTSLLEDRRSTALAAADDFLARYMQPNGRIVRHDQGGDTVSEGQAYGLLLAVAVGDETRFRTIWGWTDENLQRADGLFAWHWANGGIADYHPATDADLLIAAALALGSRRFGDRELRADAGRVGDAILDHETVTLGRQRVLVAGTWARDWRMVNASYLVTPAMSLLYEIVPEYRWGRVASSSRLLLDEMMDTEPHLPPDWAVVDAAGDNPEPVASPSGAPPRYSYDAARVIVQTAVDCRAAGQEMAAAAWPFLRGKVDTDTLVMSYTLDGSAISSEEHPLMYVAAAAAASAAGARTRADDLLGKAALLDAANPTYFGAAWVALARLWLDTGLLGGCRPGAPARA